MLKGLLLFAATLAAAVSAQSSPFAPNTPYSAVYAPATKTWAMATGCTAPDYAACATLDDGVWTTGWYTLNVRANPAAADSVQAYGAGYAEGALTQQQMWDSFVSWANGTSYVWPSAAVKQFALAQDAWVRAQAAQATTPYWSSVALVLAQWDGLWAGYTAYAPAAQQLAYDQWVAFQLQDECGDIATALNVSDASAVQNPALQHCSSLVRVSDDGQRLFAAHDTWSEFSSMLRVFKHFDFAFSEASGSAVAGGQSFSSFPGAVPSIDDFYVTSARLTVMETTIGVMNNTLFNLHTTTSTVPYWIRVTVANRMAATGEQWMDVFGQYNSGTYNNEWMVVDNKRFSAGQSGVQPGTLWVGEQIPGYLVSQDMSATLQETGYWASYNIPAFPFVFNISGYPAYVERYGNTWSHDHCARANIFRRDAPAVQTLDDMKRLMRYNEWQTDALSEQDSCRGISARCDLNPPWATNPLNAYSAFGAIDSKVTTDVLSATRTAVAVSGPTWDAQPVFAWTRQWADVLHYGQPQVFNFDWVVQAPQDP